MDKQLRFNWIVNVVDAGFFGLGLGFSSVVTILPLFVSHMTDSAILIGLIPAIQKMGWQLPQLLTVDSVARLSRYKPTVLWMTIHERIPYFGLAAVAWLLPSLGTGPALPLTFAFLIWQGLGGGLTATAWQSMLGKLIPARHRGTFFGTQEAASSMLASGGVVVAGLILEAENSDSGFALCFLLAGLAMGISMLFLALTREPAHPAPPAPQQPRAVLRDAGSLLRRDANFRWFLVARVLSQMALSVFAFYIVYAVRHHGMNQATAGVMTGLLLVTQIAANPILGWLSDRITRRSVMMAGSFAAAASPLLAWLAPGLDWFYLVFVLAGVANVAFWTVAMAMTLEFGTDRERPAYVALTNTLIAPSAIVGPILGGWLADSAGYPATFVAAAVVAVLTALVLQVAVREPRQPAAI